jgi:hypothetical protein
MMVELVPTDEFVLRCHCWLDRISKVWVSDFHVDLATIGFLFPPRVQH